MLFEPDPFVEAAVSLKSTRSISVPPRRPVNARCNDAKAPRWSAVISVGVVLGAARGVSAGTLLAFLFLVLTLRLPGRGAARRAAVVLAVVFTARLTTRPLTQFTNTLQSIHDAGLEQRMDLLGNKQKRISFRYLAGFDWGDLESSVYHEQVDHYMNFGPDKRFWYGSNSQPPAAPEPGTPCSPIRLHGDPLGSCAAGMPMYSESKTLGAKVQGDIDHIRSAAEGFLGMPVDEIQATIKETVAGHLRGIVGTLTVEELYRDQRRFQEKVREEAHVDLEGMGFEFRSFVFRAIQDDQGYLDALGQPKIQEALKVARIATAEADRDAKIEEEAARQQKEQKRIGVDTEIAEADKARGLPQPRRQRGLRLELAGHHQVEQGRRAVHPQQPVEHRRAAHRLRREDRVGQDGRDARDHDRHDGHQPPVGGQDRAPRYPERDLHTLVLEGADECLCSGHSLAHDPVLLVELSSIGTL